MMSQMHGALWGYGVRTDRAWAALQARNIAMLRARGRATAVHPALVRQVRPYINDGRWVLDCACRSGVVVDLNFGTGRCFECGAVYTDQQVRLPKGYERIERELLRLYPHDSTLRDWRPGQTLKDLRGRHHSWTTPRTWTTGELVTASIGNTHWRDNFNETAPAKVTTANDMLYATAANTLARLAATASAVLVTSAGSVPSFSTTLPAVNGAALTGLPLKLTLLKAGSGSTTNTSAETLDSVALASSLTADDALLLIVNYSLVTQGLAGAGIELRNVTDGVTISSQHGAAAGVETLMISVARKDQSSAVEVEYLSWRGTDVGALTGASAQVSFTTDWVGAWSVGAYHAGVVSGGTMRWSWAAYRIAGQ